MKKSHTICLFISGLVLAALMACQVNTTIFEEYRQFEDLSWSRFDILEFSTVVEDVQSPVDIFLSIRHLPEIPYKSMAISYTIYSPAGDMRSSDYSFELVDQEGESLSNCMGDYCDLMVPIREAFTISESGRIKFEIENKYTKIEMPGIIEVGLIMKKSKAE